MLYVSGRQCVVGDWCEGVYVMEERVPLNANCATLWWRVGHATLGWRVNNTVSSTVPYSSYNDLKGTVQYSTTVRV